MKYNRNNYDHKMSCLHENITIHDIKASVWSYLNHAYQFLITVKQTVSDPLLFCVGYVSPKIRKNFKKCS